MSQPNPVSDRAAQILRPTQSSEHVTQNAKDVAYISADMTFREVGKIAMELYSKQEFKVFQHQFDQIRQDCATGLGSLEQIAILDKKNEPTLKGIFSVMNMEQSQRFQNEFFDAMLPHWISQQDIWKNLRETKSGEYEFKLQGSWITKMLFKFMAKVLSEQEFVEAVVMTQKGTWVDDDKKTIRLSATLR